MQRVCGRRATKAQESGGWGVARGMLGEGMRTISQRPADLARPVARAMALTLGVLAGAGIWAWWSQYEQRALLSLPVAERVRIYDRNLESMRVLCGDSKLTGAFESRCREQALFLAEFPECDSACRTLVEPHLRPSR